MGALTWSCIKVATQRLRPHLACRPMPGGDCKRGAATAPQLNLGCMLDMSEQRSRRRIARCGSTPTVEVYFAACS